MSVTLKEACVEIVERHRTKLTASIRLRRAEMRADTTDHYLIYRLLGIEADECAKIDLYQNIGRFVYKYAGAMLEELTRAVISQARDGRRIYIKNTISSSPKQFEIDCYCEGDKKAHEIKWSDATTDGDHINKELAKIEAIVQAGYVPVRVMYYYPQRTQAQKIQRTITAHYTSVGEAYVGNNAWEYIKTYTGFDLKGFLEAELRRQEASPDQPRLTLEQLKLSEEGQ
jgi:hypothetical protein